MTHSKFADFARNAIQAAVSRDDVPGGVVLAVRDGALVCHEAVGDRARVPEPLPMLRDTIFDLASLTKPLATMFALLVLRRDGVLPNFDQGIGELIPALADSDKVEIPLATLLSHTSGLPPYLDVAGISRRYRGAPGDEQVLRGIKDAPLAAPAGTAVRYSCLNFILAARAVQEVTGRRMDRFLQEKIWRPLGFLDTFFFPAPAQKKRCAPTTCTDDGSCLQGVVHDPLARLIQGDERYCSGNAGLFSTAADISVLLSVLVDGWNGEAAKAGPRKSLKRPIVPAALVHEIWQTCTPSGQKPVFGRGWGVYGPEHDFGSRSMDRPLFGHTGYTGTFVWIDPGSRSWLVLLTNRVHPRDEGTVQPLRKELVEGFRATCA